MQSRTGVVAQGNHKMEQSKTKQNKTKASSFVFPFTLS